MDDFVMPNFSLLLFKQTQIEAMQKVREQVNVAFQPLQEQSHLIRKLMGQQGGGGGYRKSGSHHKTEQQQHYENPQDYQPAYSRDPPNAMTRLTYNQQSPAEEKIWHIHSENDDAEAKKLFRKELWILKPPTKKRDLGTGGKYIVS